MSAVSVTGGVEKVLVSEDRGVMIITINRPEVRNAIDAATAAAIDAAVTALDARDELTVGVITGAGSTFAAGMDLKAFLRGERPSTEARGFAGLVERPPAKPLIAAVEGHAVAGGFEIALACDLVVAAGNAVFGLPEVKRGLLPGGGGVLRLAERVPRAKAMEWILTGRYFSAAEALASGLVNQVVEPGQATAAAVALGREIAANGPLAVRAAKQIVTEARDWPLGEQFARQQVIYGPVRASEDAREGALAFTEKRAPVWRGR